MKQISIASFNIVAGIGTGIAIHYFLYRFSIPSTPFIYVSF
jgi:hypothetical protein